MLQARGTQQPGPVTELCRWLYRPVKAETEEAEVEEGRYKHRHRYAHTYTHKDALKLKYTSPLLKKGWTQIQLLFISINAAPLLLQR